MKTRNNETDSLVTRRPTNITDIENIREGKLKEPHLAAIILSLLAAIYSGYLYWSSSEPGGQRWSNATDLPIFPIAPQVGGSITNAIFNYVTFRQLSEAITQPIGHFSNRSTEIFFRIIHWIVASAIGVSTTIPQWYISLNKKNANTGLITSSAILNVLVQTQGASLLLISSYSFLKKQYCRKQTKKEKQIERLESLKQDSQALSNIIEKIDNNTSPIQLEQLLLEDTQPANQEEIQLIRRTTKLKSACYILAALGLWMNVPISIGTFVDTTQLTNSITCGIVSTLFTGIANAGYYLFELRVLSDMLKTSPTTARNQDSTKCETLFKLIIGFFSLFSGFTVGQINWMAFENDLSQEWLWTTSIIANLGAALYFNLIQSLLAPGMLMRQPKATRQRTACIAVIDKVITGLPENFEPSMPPQHQHTQLHKV